VPCDKVSGVPQFLLTFSRLPSITHCLFSVPFFLKVVPRDFSSLPPCNIGLKIGRDSGAMPKGRLADCASVVADQQRCSGDPFLEVKMSSIMSRRRLTRSISREMCEKIQGAL
jgi:hypothetical protein